MITFEVPGRPVPAVRMTGRGKFVKANAQRYLAYKDVVGLMARKYIKNPYKGSVVISVGVYLYGKTTKMGMDGDASNYLKAAEDALNGIAYDDDRQIIEANVQKIPADRREDERMVIWLREVKEVAG